MAAFTFDRFQVLYPLGPYGVLRRRGVSCLRCVIVAGQITEIPGLEGRRLLGQWFRRRRGHVDDALRFSGRGSLQVGGQIGLAVPQAELAADILAMPPDRGRRDAAQLGDFLRGQAIANHRADGDLHGRQLYMVPRDVGQEGRGDLLETAAQQRHIGALPAGDFQLQLEDDGHDDLLDIEGDRGLDLFLLLFQPGQDCPQGDIGLLERLVLVLDSPMGRPQVGQGFHVHHDAADAFGDRPQQGILLLEKRAGDAGGNHFAIEDLHYSGGPAVDHDVRRHPPLALGKPLRDVLPAPVNDARARVLGKLPALGQTVRDALEKSVRRLEVDLAKGRDRIHAIQFLDSFPQGDFEFRLRAAAGRIRFQNCNAFPQSGNLFEPSSTSRRFGHGDYPSNTHTSAGLRVQYL